ncbi:unnamed protein product [Arabis nemorensis]|uniref:Uncharacterized protein n=1 Tax=Arabis nemorensis TaxID=586526 RepID=A0A565CAU1_9BRAS|nr:unnamed protein product [Arabis nemorensis]
MDLKQLDGPPAFSLRYSENCKRVLERDRTYPEINACGWKPHCDRFATAKSAENYGLLKKSSSLYLRGVPFSSTKKFLLSDHDNLATLLRSVSRFQGEHMMLVVPTWNWRPRTRMRRQRRLMVMVRHSDNHLKMLELGVAFGCMLGLTNSGKKGETERT